MGLVLDGYLKKNILNSLLSKKIEIKLGDVYFLKNFIDSTFQYS